MAIIIVDTAEKTTAFLDDIAGLISGGLVIVEDVDVHTQADGRPR
jgi:PII-like signaling protein